MWRSLYYVRSLEGDTGDVGLGNIYDAVEVLYKALMLRWNDTVCCRVFDNALNVVVMPPGSSSARRMMSARTSTPGGSRFETLT